MKRLFLLAGAAFAMASCAQNEVCDVNADNPDVIKVGTYVGQATRGEVFDQDGVKESGFGIMAYQTGQDAWADGQYTPDFMYNQEVVYGNSAWSYSPIKYWPSTENDKLSFFTYAPYPTADNGVSAAETANDAAGLPQIAFTLQEDAADMIDFVAGQNIDMKRQKERVVYNMKHQLSRVTFSAKSSVDNVEYGASADGDGESYIIVKSMTVANSSEFYTEGVYTHAAVTTNNDKADHTQDGEWTVSSPAEYSFDSVMDIADDIDLGGYQESGVAIPIATQDYTSLFADDQYLFLLPPNGADGLSEDGIQIEVVYDVVTVDDQLAAGYALTEATNTITLPAGSLAQGKAYNYQLTIDVTEILVDANIVDWDDSSENVSGGTVGQIVKFDATIPESIYVGEEKDIEWTIDPEGEVTWESSDDTTLTVDPTTGKLTGVKPGTATITAKDENGNILKEQEVAVETEVIKAPVVTDKENNILTDRYVIEFYVDETYEFDVATHGGISYEAVATYSVETGTTFLQKVEGTHVSLIGRRAGDGAILKLTDEAGNVLTYTVNVLARTVSATAVAINGLTEFKFPSASSDNGETLTTTLSVMIVPEDTTKDYTWTWTIEDSERDGTAFAATVTSNEDGTATVSMPSYPGMSSTTLTITATAVEDESLADTHELKVLTPIGFDVTDPDKPGIGGGVVVVTPGLGDGGNTDLE